MEQFSSGKKLIKKSPTKKKSPSVRNYAKYLKKPSGKSLTDKKNIHINRKRPISPKKSRKISSYLEKQKQAILEVGGAAPAAPAAPNAAAPAAAAAPASSAAAAADAPASASAKRKRKKPKRSNKSTKRHTKRNNSRQVKVTKPLKLTDEHIKRVEKKIQNIRKQKLSDMKKELEKRGVKTTGKSNRLLKDIYLYSKMSNINFQHEK